MTFRTSVAAIVLCAAVYATADKKRDPLTATEVDKVRETAMEPEKRLPLYVEFAKARLMAIEQLRADNKLKTDRGKQIHDLLEDFTTLSDELDNNIDMFERKHQDMRKALKQVVEAYTDWQLKLRGIKEDSSIKDEERKAYDFPLESAIESVNSGLDDARDALDKQNKDYQESKKKK